MKTRLEDPVALTREIIREYYQGNVEPWFRRLCPKSVWVGAGEQTIIGGEAIRERFGSVEQRRAFQIFQEEYRHFPISARASLVAAEVTIGGRKSEAAHMAISCTMLYQLVAGETKATLTHATHGFLRNYKPERDSALTWVPAYHLYRNLLLDLPEAERIAVPSGGRTFYIHPNAILYIRSKERRAELFCVDSVVRTDLTITQMNALLPEAFFPIHRCYTVNPRYVSSIQRYKVTMVTGETLPVPAEAYNRVKAGLDRRISGLSAGPERFHDGG